MEKKRDDGAAARLELLGEDASLARWCVLTISKGFSADGHGRRAAAELLAFIDEGGGSRKPKPRSTITHPGFRGQPNEKTDAPGHRFGVRMSELGRELEEVARGLALRPEPPRMRELSARLEKASTEIRKLVERLP